MAECSGSESMFSGLEKPLVVAHDSMLQSLLETTMADSNAYNFRSACSTSQAPRRDNITKPKPAHAAQ